MSYLHCYMLSPTCSCIDPPLPLQPQFSPFNLTTPQPDLYHTKHVNHVYILQIYIISSPLVAAVTSAAAVVVATFAWTGVPGVDVVVGGGIGCD